MGPKTLFAVLMKALGVYFLLSGAVAFLEYIPYVLDDDYGWGTGAADWSFYWNWFVYAGVWPVLGIWLIFKGQVLANWVIAPAGGRCEECGYTIRGVESNRCPECGSLLRQTRSARAVHAPIDDPSNESDAG